MSTTDELATAELIRCARWLTKRENFGAAIIPMSGLPDGRFIAIGTLDDILRLIKLQVVDDAQ